MRRSELGLSAKLREPNGQGWSNQRHTRLLRLPAARDTLPDAQPRYRVLSPEDTRDSSGLLNN